MLDPAILDRIARNAIAGTLCQCSTARSYAAELAAQADDEGIAYDAAMLADVVADALYADGWTGP